jgi:F-type H+-transporting ATPase subunit epsilon
MPTLQCIVVTPERTLVDRPAEFVVVPLYDGELGIAPAHSPMIGRLGAGELRMRNGDEEARYYVEGGFVEVIGNVVSVLTSRAVPAKDLDVAVAQEQLASARTRVAHTPDALAARDKAVAQARAQIRVARRTHRVRLK